MAKIGLTKLGLQKQSGIVPIQINDQTIEVKQYLPIQEKLELISRIINASNEESKFYNPGKLSVFFNLEILQTYTNINLTDKQKEEFCKTFDLLASNNIFTQIIEAIPQAEINTLLNWTMESVKSLYEYGNSVRGILESVQNDYSDLDLDITKLQEKIKDPESLDLLKQIAPMLGLA